MRIACRHLAAVLVGVAASPALGGLIVTSYHTLAQTRGFAPTSQTQYFAEQRLDNTSPADAQVSGDWTGPNADGTPNTWHFVGTSRTTSRTTITPESYTVEAAGSFAYSLDTTSEFVDPRSISVFGPGGTANYNGFFETDMPLGYAVTVQLNLLGRVRLNRIGGAEIFDEINPGVAPQILNLSGTLGPGRYQLLATSSLGLGNQPSGIIHAERSGSYENLFFTVRVPEPGAFAVGISYVAGMLLKRRHMLG